MRRADVVVVGAGIHGLSAAWSAARGGARVVVVEQFRPGHDRGSSHGMSRITRTSYRDAAYARLAIAAQRDDWPRLERDAGERLVVPAPGLFFGPADGAVRDYERAVAAAGAPVDRLSPREARSRFPQFAFPGDPTVLHDRSAGVVAASATIAALARVAARCGAEIVCDTRTTAIRPAADHVEVATDRGVFAAGCVIVAAGAWVRTLVPSIAPRLSVVRQTVVYADMGSEDADAFRPPRFPVWVWLGRDEHDHFYGLPEFGRPGLKAARHATGTGSEDPDAPHGAPPDAAIDEVRAFLASELTSPVRGVVAWERCLYTNEPRQEFLMGPLRSDPRVVVGAACSGHAFKFGPLVGRALAELALRGATTSPEAAAIVRTIDG